MSVHEQVAEAQAAGEDVESLTMPLSARAAIEKVLTEAEGPLTTKQIVEQVLPLVNLKGKTPASTIAAILSVESKKEDGLFQRTDKATYALR